MGNGETQGEHKKVAAKIGTHPLFGMWSTMMPATGDVEIDTDPEGQILNVSLGDVARYFRLQQSLEAERVVSGPLEVTLRMRVVRSKAGPNCGPTWMALVEQGEFLTDPVELQDSEGLTIVRTIWHPSGFRKPLCNVRSPLVVIQFGAHSKVAIEELRIRSLPRPKGSTERHHLESLELRATLKWLVERYDQDLHEIGVELNQMRGAIARLESLPPWRIANALAGATRIFHGRERAPATLRHLLEKTQNAIRLVEVSRRTGADVNADADAPHDARSSKPKLQDPSVKVARSRGVPPTNKSERHVAALSAYAYFARHQPRWAEEKRVAEKPPSSAVSAERLRVLVGTLDSGENELEACKSAIRAQTHSSIEHVVISGLGKKEAIAALMERFVGSSADILIKVDADMVLLDPQYVARVCRVFAANDRILILQMSIMDWFSGDEMQGINAYRKGIPWRPDAQHDLFTDRIVGLSKGQRLIDWVGFVDSALHCPNPTPFQAFHFGVHRGAKVAQPGNSTFSLSNAEEHLIYLEKTWEHFLVRHDPRLGFACLGFELALTEAISVEQLSYSDPYLATRFAEFESWDSHRILAEVTRRRSCAAFDTRTEAVRERRRALYDQSTAPVRRVLALLPHTLVFGGVNRMFQVGRWMRHLGVEFTIAIPDEELTGTPVRIEPRADFPDVPVVPQSEALLQEWDVVLSGDVTGGGILATAAFNARLSVVWLVNGWLYGSPNLGQIEVARPDVVIANSSYAAQHYASLAPLVVAGGVALDTFVPEAGLRPRDPNVFRVGCYPGRFKENKRFSDTQAACRLLAEWGVPVELHVYDQKQRELRGSFPIRHHGALDGAGVRNLLISLDAMLCPELDAGWSNPAAEAMACGVPLVCTEAGTTDFAEDGVTALVVPVGSPEAMAEALRRLYVDVQLAERLRTAGLDRIRSFAWPTVARNLLHVLRVARKDREQRERLSKAAVAKYDGGCAPEPRSGHRVSLEVPASEAGPSPMVAEG